MSLRFQCYFNGTNFRLPLIRAGVFRDGRRAASGIEVALLIAFVAIILISTIVYLGSSVSRISCGTANVLGGIAAGRLNDGGSTTPCVPPDTCSGVAAGQYCNRLKNDGSGVDKVIVVTMNTLYAWPLDQTAIWNGGYPYCSTGNTSTSPADGGKAYSDAEAVATCSGASYIAAQTCYNHGTSHTAGDWYLPAANDLTTMLNVAGSSGKGALVFNINGALATRSYWSSSEFYNDGAYMFYYSGGWYSTSSPKNASLVLRCVRR